LLIGAASRRYLTNGVRRSGHISLAGIAVKDYTLYTMDFDESDHKRSASEAIKDLMVTEKRSSLPLILGVLVLMVLLGGGWYWYHFPAGQRPTLDQMKARVMALGDKVLNAPVMRSSAPQAATDTSTNTKGPASSSKKNAGLLSK